MTTLTEEEHLALLVVFDHIQSMLIRFRTFDDFEDIKRLAGQTGDEMANAIDHLKKVFSVEGDVEEKITQLRQQLGK